MIIFGTRCFGGTDTVPGVFHVTTKFFHIDFLPLVPCTSYLVLELRGEDGRVLQRATELPALSCRSISIAWIRFVATVIMIATFVWMVVSLSDLTDPDFDGNILQAVGSFFAFVASSSLAYYCMWGSYFRNATYDRATEICAQLGPTGAAPLLKALVDRHFQQAGSFVAVAQEDENATIEVDGTDALPVAVPICDVEMGPQNKQEQETPLEAKTLPELS